jgi:hypothetical protein
LYNFTIAPARARSVFHAAPGYLKESYCDLK